jgi:hypothetical protein
VVLVVLVDPTSLWLLHDEVWLWTVSVVQLLLLPFPCVLPPDVVAVVVSWQVFVLAAVALPDTSAPDTSARAAMAATANSTAAILRILLIPVPPLEASVHLCSFRAPAL